jgi:hypothetical protein
MKQGMHGMAMALLVILCANRPLSLRAQDGRQQENKPLDKTVTVKADHERLEDVLDELAKKGYFTFSYQSDILKKERLVTLTLKESTLREALELILGNAYEYVGSDDYVVIRRREPMARKEFRRDPEDRKYVKEKAFRKAVMPRMKETLRMKMMKRGMPYGSDSLNMLDSLKMVKLRVTVRNIVNDMIADGIVRDKDSFSWFGLDDGQFIVDGKHITDSLQVKYAAKYVKDGNGYYYGSVSVRGHGYFFGKKEIYGDGTP